MRWNVILIILALAVVFLLSVLVDNRIAAGVGAAMLLAGLIYGYVRTRGGSPAEIARAERGARELHEELADDEERRGTR